MGLDISAQAVDVALFRDRILPSLLEGDPVDDLFARAADIAAAQARTGAWGSALYKAYAEIADAQHEIVSARRRTEMVEAEGPRPSVLARLFGARPARKLVERVVYERVPGLPGFDTDRDLWGRPFLIVGDDSARAVDDLDRYLLAARDGEAAIDRLVLEMLTRLEAARSSADLSAYADDLAAVLQDARPLTAIMTSSPDGTGVQPQFDRKQFIRSLVRRWDLWREALGRRDLDGEIRLSQPGSAGPAGPWGDGDDAEFEEDEVFTVHDARVGLPLELMGFAAMLLPGWMGRGHVFATELLPKIGVRCDDLFEPPEPLLRPLLRAAPEIREGLHSTIVENFCVGGWVPPERVPALVERLEANRKELILAWTEPAERAGLTPAEIEEMSSDYVKLIEPARYALKHGYGYVEAAEIYSAPLGVFN